MPRQPCSTPVPSFLIRTRSTRRPACHAERIVIATGGHPTRVPFPGSEHAIISDDAFYLPAMPRRVAVLGSGYIALEFAGIFAALGAQVDLVYRAPLPLRGFDQDMREAVAEALIAQGITLHPGCTPRRAGTERRRQDPDAEQRHRTDDGAGVQRAWPCAGDRGTRPRRGRGRNERHRRGDGGRLPAHDAAAYLRIGDVTDRLNLTPVATAEGHALADSLYGNLPRSISFAERSYRGVHHAARWPPSADRGAGRRARPVDVYVSKFTPMRHTISGRARRSVMKLVVTRRHKKVLGAHMLGEDAPEIMQGLAIALVMGPPNRISTRTIGIHPTAARVRHHAHPHARRAWRKRRSSIKDRIE